MTVTLGVQLIVNILALFVTIAAVRKRMVPKVTYYFLLSLAVYFYSLGYLYELDARSLETAYLAQRIQYIGVSVYAVLYYLFVRDYNDRPIRQWWKLALLFAFPAAVLALVNAYPDSRLYFMDMAFVEAPSPRLLITRGVLHHLHVLYSYVFIALCAWEIVRHYPHAGRSDKRRRRVFLLSTVVPSAAIVVFAFDNLPVPMQFGSLSLVISLLLLGAYLLRYRARDWLPFAREQIVEGLRDGYVLIDNEYRYLDANAVAIGYFPALGEMKPGSPVREATGFPARLLDDLTSIQDIELARGDETVWLRASVSPVRYGDSVVCTSVLLYDVTERHRLMAEMAELATRDALTGLYNRRAFFWLAERDFTLHRRVGNPETVMMADIDLFKRVNDTYGHPAGDDVLRRVAAVMTGRLRGTDIGGRYGGEEFCVLLPDTDADGATRIAEDIRRAVEETSFEASGERFRVTVSIGLAPVDAGRHPTLEAQISDADAALYRAKKTGRNRTVVFDAEML